MWTTSIVIYPKSSCGGSVGQRASCTRALACDWHSAQVLTYSLISSYWPFQWYLAQTFLHVPSLPRWPDSSCNASMIASLSCGSSTTRLSGRPPEGSVNRCPSLTVIRRAFCLNFRSSALDRCSGLRLKSIHSAMSWDSSLYLPSNGFF